MIALRRGVNSEESTIFPPATVQTQKRVQGFVPKQNRKVNQNGDLNTKRGSGEQGEKVCGDNKRTMSSVSSFSIPSLAAVFLVGAALLLLLSMGAVSDDQQEHDDAPVFAVEGDSEEASEFADVDADADEEEEEQWSDWLLFEEADEEMDMDVDVEFASEEEEEVEEEEEDEEDEGDAMEGASILSSSGKVPTMPGQKVLTKYEMAQKSTLQNKGKEKLPVCLSYLELL